MTAAAPAPPRFDLDLKPTPGLYLAVGLVAGAVIALQIGIMRIFAVGSWAHFGSLVVSLAMLGFGLTSAVMCIAQGLVRAALARRRRRPSLLLFGPLTVAAEPDRAADSVQRHLPGLRPDAEVAARRQLRALPAAVPRRRASSSAPCSSRRSRIFGRVYFADLTGAGLCGLAVPGGDVRLAAGEPHRRAAGAVGRRQRCSGSRGRGSRRRHRLARRRGGRRVAGSLRAAAAARHPEARGLRLQGRRLRAQLPRRRARLRAASRRSATCRSTPARTCTSRRASPTTPRSTCRSCRPTPISACTSTAKARAASCATCRPSETAYFRFLPMYLSLSDQAGARHLRGAVRRRHLDLGGAAQRLASASRWPRATRRCSTPSAPTRACATSPATSSHDPQDHASSTTTAGSTSPHTSGPLRRHRSEPRRLGRPVEPRRLRHRREVRLHARGDARATCARSSRRRHPVGHAVEQGRAAEVGAEALRHHGRGGARASTPATSPIASSSSSSYLSTTTVLYKRGGFTADEIAKLREHTAAMSFDEIYYPGLRLRRRRRPARCSTTTATRSSAPASRAAGRSRTPTATDAPTGAAAADDRRPQPPPTTRRGAAGDHHGPARLAPPESHGGWDEIADALRVRHPPAHQRPALFRRLCEARRPAARHSTGSSCCRTSGAICCSGRRSASPASPRSSLVLLPVIFGWRTDLQPQSRQVPHHRLFRLPRRSATSWSRSG